jgi:hypothetical protein
MVEQPCHWENYEQEFQYYAALYREKNIVADAFKAITAGKAAIDGLTMLSRYANEVKDIQKRGEFMRIIGELSLELSQVQIRLAEQLRENNSLREETEALKKEIDKLKNPASKLIIKNGLYYTEDDDGPFCTACYDSNKQTIRVTETSRAMRPLGKYICPVCNTPYTAR